MNGNLSPPAWVNAATKLLVENQNQQQAKAMEAYMKEQFPFYGIPKPMRTKLFKELFSLYGIPEKEEFREIVYLLWNQPYRELHYLAFECLLKNKKHFEENDIALFEEMMRTHSWWDSIDFISPTLVRIWLKKFPNRKESLLRRWNLDDDFWIRRASLIAQLKEKSETDHLLLFSLIIPLTCEKEFFIRKSIGWCLRELAKYKPNGVLSFVEHCEMSNLSRREALKHLSS